MKAASPSRMPGSAIHFVRKYPYYFKLNKPARAYSFSVTISTQKKINPKTGMSVDLLQLNKIASLILKNKPQALTVQEQLALTYKQFIQHLRKQNIAVAWIQFDECRGAGYLFKENQVFLIRQDLATDDRGDLFQVTSYFDQKNKLQQLKLKDLKKDVVEQIIF